jgi:metal-responsive CopG/Arc/MetJ family transcriptional regulator
MKRLYLDLPDNVLTALDQLIEAGWAKTRTELIFRALVEWPLVKRKLREMELEAKIRGTCS